MAKKIIISVLMVIMFLTLISGFGMNTRVKITFEDGRETYIGDWFYGTEKSEQCIQNWSCGNWSECGNEAETGIETEIIIRIWDMDGNPIEIPDWVSSSNKSQTRVCLDLNECNNDTNKPIEIKECEENTNISEINKSDEDEIITINIVNQTNETQINQTIQIFNDTNQTEDKTADTFDDTTEDIEEEVAEQRTTTSLETQEISLSGEEVETNVDFVVPIKEKDFFEMILDWIKNVWELYK